MREREREGDKKRGTRVVYDISVWDEDSFPSCLMSRPIARDISFYLLHGTVNVMS